MSEKIKHPTSKSDLKEKYVFLIDIDGTLVPAGGDTIKESTVQEITRLKSDGHIFVISTGRSLITVLDLKGNEVFDFFACLTGSEIYDCRERKIIKHPESLNKDEVKALVKIIDGHALSWVYKNDQSDNTYSHDAHFISRHQAKVVTQDDFIRDLDRGNVCQLLIDKYISDEEMSRFKKLNFFKMPDNYTDVINFNLSKRVVVEYFRDKFPDKKIVAIGDSINDKDMLTASDISIAMGNASEDIKRLTTFTTKSVTEDGLVYAFKDILGL